MAGGGPGGESGEGCMCAGARWASSMGGVVGEAWGTGAAWRPWAARAVCVVERFRVCRLASCWAEGLQGQGPRMAE